MSKIKNFQNFFIIMFFLNNRSSHCEDIFHVHRQDTLKSSTDGSPVEPMCLEADTRARLTVPSPGMYRSTRFLKPLFFSFFFFLLGPSLGEFLSFYFLKANRPLRRRLLTVSSPPSRRV